MHEKKLIFSLAGSLLVGGCASNVQPIYLPDVGVVQGEIKRQVAIYIAADRDSPTLTLESKERPLRTPKKDEFWCGEGNIRFEITSIKADLTTTQDVTNGATFSVGIPIGASGANTLTPSAGTSRENVDTQLLTYNIWPLSAERQPNLTGFHPDKSQIDSAPIAKALLDMRNALIRSSLKQNYPTTAANAQIPQACFYDYNPANPSSDAGNSFKVGLTAINDPTRGIQLVLGPLKLGATTETKTTTGNAITVTFVQRNLSPLIAAKERVDTDCKYPMKTAADNQRCADSKEALKDLTEKTSFGELFRLPNR